MSVVDQLKNVFSRGKPAGGQDSQLSLGMPDATLDPRSTEQLAATPSEAARLAGRSTSTVRSTVDINLAPDEDASDLIAVPLLGKKTVAAHQKLLLIMLGLALVLLAVVTLFSFSQANRVTQQLGATGQSLMQSQRLAKSVSQALVGSAQAFPEVVESAGVLAKSVRGLRSGDAELGLDALSTAYQPELEKIEPLVERAEKSAAVVIAQQTVLTQVSAALRSVNQQSTELLTLTESLAASKLQKNAAAPEVAATNQLAMLTQRIARTTSEFLTAEGATPDAVFRLGKDLNTFREITQGLLDGSADLGLSASQDPSIRTDLQILSRRFEATSISAGAVMSNLQGLVAARKAQASILTDSEPLRRQLEDLQLKLSAQAGLGAVAVLMLVGVALFALACAAGLSYVQLQDSKARQGVAESQRVDAQRQQQEAKRVNDANQAAILRLMNELQAVAEGDLTQEATVTEDITGAIADSVNYTVEELRSLVGNVQKTVTRVAQTTADVDTTSTELLAASNEQLHEIRETGRSVVDMASRINDVSAQAQESASVARQSLQAAEVGLQAVQNAIGGMNSIRDQIQDTSKRIKRLGESSQEIGEITELISDITEQTNVLALNAAIQAASAGEAGRGFSVVAEEVQRLAERSADATRQIAALVKAIQTDTQDAVGAMERSTQGVVEGAKLSDNAGTALTEIDQVSRRLAELIEQISSSTSREASLANEVAENIQHIFAVTEQTGEGTRSTAAQVRELSKMAEELLQSVARFKIV
jgi:twitching motility protein PilJ